MDKSPTNAAHIAQTYTGAGDVVSYAFEFAEFLYVAVNTLAMMSAPFAVDGFNGFQNSRIIIATLSGEPAQGGWGAILF